MLYLLEQDPLTIDAAIQNLHVENRHAYPDSAFLLEAWDGGYEKRDQFGDSGIMAGAGMALKIEVRTQQNKGEVWWYGEARVFVDSFPSVL